MRTLCKLLHPENAAAPMLVKPDGSVTYVSLSQPKNAFAGIDVTPFGILTLTKYGLICGGGISALFQNTNKVAGEQPKNTLVPMVVRMYDCVRLRPLQKMTCKKVTGFCLTEPTLTAIIYIKHGVERVSDNRERAPGRTAPATVEQGPLDMSLPNRPPGNGEGFGQTLVCCSVRKPAAVYETCKIAASLTM